MKKLLSIALFSLMVIGLGSTAFAGPGDTGTFAGTVIDLEYGEPVAEAMVFIRICMQPEGGHGGQGGQHLYSATTNEAGEFFIDNVPAGEWEAVARLRGVGRDEQSILIEAGNTTIVTFELEANGCPGGLQMRLHQGGN